VVHKTALATGASTTMSTRPFAERRCRWLRKAASLSPDPDSRNSSPARRRALTDDYYASDIAWVELKTRSHFIFPLRDVPDDLLA